MSLYSTITRDNCVQEAKTAIEALIEERGDNTRLRSKLEQAERNYGAVKERAKAPFKRGDFESMTRQQLVSLIEEAINEARRKGMVEAEGLLARHREHSNETDLEMMRGVISTYQARTTAIELDKRKREDQAREPVKLDTRTLPELSSFSAPAFKAPGWWRSDPLDANTNVVKAKKDFAQFDEQARAVTSAVRAKDLSLGARIPVKGDSGGTYVLSRPAEGVYSCTCPRWQFMECPVEQRSCKHLVKRLGAAFEADRTLLARKTVEAGRRCHCDLLLVRGQCPKHTQDWKGPELCTCGRKFASCRAAYNTISVAQRRFGHQPDLAR